MDVAEEKDEEYLLAWYAKVLTRRVDLVGDYAGKELFLIEGDSLLLHCLSTSKVDLDGTSSFVSFTKAHHKLRNFHPQYQTRL